MGTPLRVLIVEDSEEDTLLIVRELKRGGFDPIHERVETAEAMKAALSTKTWDLILADYSMPHFSGLEALKLSKERGLDLPFIIVSGSIGEDIAVEAMKSGAHDYLMKNNLTRLIPAIQQGLRGTEGRRKLKVSQNALQESEKRYRQVVENATEIIYAVDDKGNFTYGNPAGLKVTGYSLAELRSFNYTDLVLPEHRERVSQAYINQFRQRIRTTHIEFPFFNKAGKIIWFGQNTSLVIEDGKVVGFHIIARDITERKHAEEVLREREKKFRELFDEAPVGYFEYDSQGRITNVNRTELEMLGYTPEEMIGQPVWKFIIEEEEAHQQILAKLAGTMPPARDFERTYRRKNGTTFPALIGDRLLRDEKGRITGIRATIQDITKRKQTEEALRSSEEKYRTILENIEDGYYEVDITGNFTFFNDSLCRMMGYTKDELMGMNNRQYMGKETSKKVYQVFTQLYTTGVPYKAIDWEIIRKDGIKRFHDSSVSLIRNAKGEPIGFRGIARDITERKRMEEKLRKSETRFQELFDEAPVGYHEYDVQGRITSVNRTELEMLGYTPEEMTGQPVWKFILEGNLSRQTVLDKLTGGLPPAQGLERTYLRKDGTTFPALIEDRIIRNSEGAIIGIRSTIQDITERKRAEEEREKMLAQLIQAQKMESIGTLAGGVAHDFNNLLTTIQGYAQLAMMSLKESDPFYENFKEIQQASVRAAKLTRQLLLFSRQQPMDLHLITLNETVNNLMKMLQRLIGEDMTVQTDLNPNLWTNMADPGNMEQVIMNLVVNARDAMPEGKKITIKTENVDIDEGYCEIYKYAHPGKFVCLSVEDIGIGMDKEVIQHIFEPFFTTKGPGKGTGLGLSVVYGIVKQNEGWINVYSELGRGSVFKVYLPASFVESKDETKEEVISIQDCHGKGERILLVEDDDGIREFAKRVLFESGYVGFEAANAEEALNIFGKEKGDFHLVFSDVVLPEKSGLQLVEQLLCRKPELKVLLTSGYTDQKSQWPIIREKGYRFIQKPYGLTDLLRVVREVIEQGK